MDDKSLILECDVEDTPQVEVMRIKLEDEESSCPHTTNNPFTHTTDIPDQTSMDTTYGPNEESINTIDIPDSTITYPSTAHTQPSTTHISPPYAPIHIEPQPASEAQDEDHKEPQGTESYSLVITSEDGSVQEVLIDITMESNDTEHVYPDRDNVEEEHLPQIPGTYTDSQIPGTHTDSQIPGTYTDSQIPGTHTDSQADLSTTREEHTTDIQLELVKKEYDSEGTELEGDNKPNVCSAGQNPPGESPLAVTACDVTADELAVFDTAHATKDEPHLETGSDDQQDNKSDSTNPPNNRSASENATDTNSEKPYVCDICGKGFTKYRSIGQHQRVHGIKKKKQHQCEVCNKHFNRPSLLKRHMLVHAKEEAHLVMQHAMGIGDQPANKGERKKLSDTNSEKQYVCDICGKGFTRYNGMKLHQRIHSKKERIHSVKETTRKQHACEVCNKRFRLTCHLKKHMLVHSKKTKKQYACEVCNKSFSRLFHLDVHMAVHSKEKPHQCNVCGKRFSHTLYLSAHKRRHSGYRPHKCEICGLGFMKLTDLRRHKLVHSGERPYQCQICAKSFRLKGTLAQHIKTHTKPCPPCCKQACEQNYAQSQQYQHAATVCHEQVSDNQHAAIVGKEQVIDNQDAATICKEEFQDDQHTETVGEKQVVYVGMHKTLLTTDHCKHCVVVKPHKCSVCGRSFARPYQLKSHQMVHRDRQLFKCFFCDTNFKTTSSLRSHQLHCVARPIRCSVCGQGFANTEELSNHRASKHTGWNQCKCDGCGQHIDSPSLLKSHKLVCSGKPRFKCQVCNKTLTSRQSLKAHMNIHVVTPLVL